MYRQVDMSNSAFMYKKLDYSMDSVSSFWTSSVHSESIPGFISQTQHHVYFEESMPKSYVQPEKMPATFQQATDRLFPRHPLGRLLWCMKSINNALWKRLNVKLIFKLGISYKGMGLSLSMTITSKAKLSVSLVRPQKYFQTLTLLVRGYLTLF